MFIPTVALLLLTSFLPSACSLAVNPTPTTATASSTHASKNPWVKDRDGTTPLSIPLMPRDARQVSLAKVDEMRYQFMHHSGRIVQIRASNAINLSSTAASETRDDRRERRAVTVSRQVATCLDGSRNESHINALFKAGGAGAIVFLCPSAIIYITSYINFSAKNQTLATLGYPTGSTRGTIKIASGGFTLPATTKQVNAIYAAYASASGSALRNIQVDGSRSTLGVGNEGYGMIELGGDSNGQIVDNCHLFNGRGWTLLHLIEGEKDSNGKSRCQAMQVTNNQIGPSGTPTTGVDQFPQGMAIGDGISLACMNSLVSGNTITDATDGAIVIFSSEGNTVTNNVIIAQNSQLLGGINMVDYWPMGGSFAGTLVQGNTINAQNAFIKVGIPMGQMIWMTVPQTSPPRLFGGARIIGNRFISGPKGYFGFMIGISSVSDFVVQKNTHTAHVGGVKTLACPGSYTGAPTFPAMTTLAQQSFIYSTLSTPYNSSARNSLIQKDFLPTLYASLLICLAPNEFKGNSQTWTTTSPAWTNGKPHE